MALIQSLPQTNLKPTDAELNYNGEDATASVILEQSLPNTLLKPTEADLNYNGVEDKNNSILQEQGLENTDLKPTLAELNYNGEDATTSVILNQGFQGSQLDLRDSGPISVPASNFEHKWTPTKQYINNLPQ